MATKMNEAILKARAENWIAHKRIRSSEEMDAYLQGMEDALLAV